MRLTKMLTIVILGLTSSLAMAEEVDCSKLANPQARQQCVKQKSGAEVDCTNDRRPSSEKGMRPAQAAEQPGLQQARHAGSAPGLRPAKGEVTRRPNDPVAARET